MRIANWNIARCLPSQRRASDIHEHLSGVAADIYVLTETHESLVPRSTFRGVFSSEPDRPSEAGERWAAIWSASPLKRLDDYVSDPARCVAARLADSKIGEVVVYACVLPWIGSPWRGLPSAGGRAFGAALDMYCEDWRRLKDVFPRAVLIVAGDFNQDLAPRHYYGSRDQQQALRKALRDADLIAATGDDRDPIAARSAPHACIDHICITGSAGLTIANPVRWPDEPAPVSRLSDHFGVAVDVRRAG